MLLSDSVFLIYSHQHINKIYKAQQQTLDFIRRKKFKVFLFGKSFILLLILDIEDLRSLQVYH